MILVTSVSASSMRLEISTSCSRVSSATCPIWFRYIRTGSSRMSSRDGVLLLGFGLLDIVHLGLVNDFNFQRAQLGENFVQFFRRRLVVRQRLVDVVVGQLSLLLRQADQFLDFFRKIRSWNRCEVRRRRHWRVAKLDRAEVAPLRLPFFGDESALVLRTFGLDILQQHTSGSDNGSGREYG